MQLKGRYQFREPTKLDYTYTITRPTTNNNQPALGTTITATDRRPSQGHIFNVGTRLLWNLDSKNNLYFDVNYGEQIYDNKNAQITELNLVARIQSR
ncbi:hypothetical protein DCO58_04920 [Helicobacter saguini]|uniref:Uncharacterized protein n=1 Tax=Helicobacter saguini TaxID=1548018 RepID=A0A347VSZ0_9HELI|nr:hypothetical protein [Helicobacter saguini]MWV62308.1 hypothetical protein [Helicobacter saguini]MWV67020.1 hypothetical protein [Helicobacter saguini]MWV69368.1 hypothetical protein [Helicobacter saguini]MWV71076.1 hypothetical protein [Helicobacter saguini]TLD95023.1 hypothetical protein LS64_003680 [Helicobacter saguini]